METKTHWQDQSKQQRPSFVAKMKVKEKDLLKSRPDSVGPLRSIRPMRSVLALKSLRPKGRR